jgi:NAD(P)-dependent dehydrogenase (short-subunit alcohol dehydrogenase family)
VSTEEAVKALVEKTLAIYGKIDGAVNNAGISTDAALFAELSTEEFQKMIQVNVLGLFWCMKYQVGYN